VLAAPRDDATAARPPSRKAASLSRSAIVATAIAVADAEGADAVSMRRVARELGASPMALYWHVADKDDLLTLMVDEVEGEVRIPSPSGDWHADVTATARRYRRVLLRHGWMTSFIGMRRSLGPKELPHIERSLAAFDGLGLSVRESFNIIMAIETYYLGFAMREQQELAAERAAKGVTPARRRAFVKRESKRLEATGDYPRLAELFGDGTFASRDERFEYGLQRLLDGIEASLPKR
jgi:AcrR family transcriptional regulator